MSRDSHPLSFRSRLVKRAFDVVLSALGLVLLWPIIAVAYVVARLETGKSGFYRQDRIGREGRRFQVVKLRTMRDLPGLSSSVTTAADPRVTHFGKFFRRTKIDELPQLWNVLRGDMSFVGPRPDVPGFADRLKGKDREILKIRPGITGPASLRFRNEEALLARQSDPESYNAEVIYPEKVRLNREYLRTYSFCRDLRYIRETLRRADS